MGLDVVAAAALLFAAVLRPSSIRNLKACWLAVGLLAAGILLHGFLVALLAVQLAAFCSGVVDTAALVTTAFALLPRPNAGGGGANPPTTQTPP